MFDVECLKRPNNHSHFRKRRSSSWNANERQSIFPVYDAHGFFMSDCIRDYTKFQEGSLCPLLGPHDKACIDSNSLKVLGG